MRIAEKTLEINFCANSSVALHKTYRVVWFGLTQNQEAALGFDACVRLGAKFLIFQFKASNHILKTTGQRKFKLSHDQMVKLRTLAKRNQRSVFYVFPDFGTTTEFMGIQNILSRCHLVDVRSLPNPIPPTGRKGNYHNAYLSKGTSTVKFWSEPFESPSMNAKSIFDEIAISDTYNGINIKSFGLSKPNFEEILGKDRRGMFAAAIIRK